jgi:hypothetical protein
LNIGTSIVCLTAAAALAADAAAGHQPQGQLAAPDVVLQPAPLPVSREYFGLHISKLVQPHHSGKRSYWPDLDIGSWRLWGANVTWREIEPARNQFQFERLDSLLRIAEGKGVEPVLTLGMTPTWAAARPSEACSFGPPGCASEPAQLEDWDRYVTEVVRRYKGRIKGYEVWNEPAFTEDVESNSARVHFSGSARAMVDMARAAYVAIKREDPAALVLSPAVVSNPARFQTFLRAGGVGTFDVVAYHFYAAPPERMIEIASALRKILADYGVEKMPIWNTEAGYYFERPEFGVTPDPIRNSAQDVLPERLGAAYVLRSLTLGAALDLRRFHWYDWDDEQPPWELPMGLASDSGRRLNAAGRAYGRAVQWLRGSVIEKCEGRKGALWECRLRQGPYRSILVWSAGPVLRWNPPKVAFAGELDDSVCFSALGTAQSISVGPMPWLIILDEGGSMRPSPKCQREAGR